MSRRTADRPLTDAEERCLIALADRLDQHGPDAREAWAKPCRNETTLVNLARRDLVKLRTRFGSLELEAQATDQGRRLVRGMGD